MLSAVEIRFPLEAGHMTIRFPLISDPGRTPYLLGLGKALL